MNNITNTIENLILNGQYTEALAILDITPARDNSVENRIMLHLRAQTLIHLGDLEGAKNCLIMAEKHFGENIAVIRDLACLYYQTGETLQWRRYTELLHERLLRHSSQLKPIQLIQALVSLGKFREEDGRVSEALDLFNEAVKNSEQFGLDNMVTLSRIQRLRISALYDRSAKLSDWYRELMIDSKNELSFDLWLEREHTLMLTEIELIGPEHAWARAAVILENPKTSKADQRLVIADYLAETLLRRQKPNRAALEKVSDLNEGDAFEQELGEIVKLNSVLSADSLLRLNGISSELSWAGYLRLITLYHSLTDGLPIQAELVKKLSLLLNTLPATSRFFWMKRVQAQVYSGELVIALNASSHQLIFQDKTLDLAKKRTLLSILSALSESREIEVDQFIKRLWESDFSPEHLHRLRMAIHRLNRLLFDFCSIPRVIEMTADKVSIKGTIQFTKVV